MPEQIAVQIVGPKLLRQAIGALLRTYRDIVIIDPDESGVGFVKRNAPDVLLMIAHATTQERLPFDVSDDASYVLSPSSPSSPVNFSRVALLMQGDERDVVVACSHGVQVLLGTDDDADSVHCGILAAARGESYCAPGLSGCLLRAFRRRSSPDDLYPDDHSELSAREREVARLAAVGHSNEEIAEQLHISLRTVKAHLSEVFRKLGIKRRGQIKLSVSSRASYPTVASW